MHREITQIVITTPSMPIHSVVCYDSVNMGQQGFEIEVSILVGAECHYDYYLPSGRII